MKLNLPVRRTMEDPVTFTLKLERRQFRLLEDVADNLQCTKAEVIRVLLEKHGVKYTNTAKSG